MVVSGKGKRQYIIAYTMETKIKEQNEQQEAQLNEEELDQVSGGVGKRLIINDPIYKPIKNNKQKNAFFYID